MLAVLELLAEGVALLPTDSRDRLTVRDLLRPHVIPGLHDATIARDQILVEIAEVRDAYGQIVGNGGVDREFGRDLLGVLSVEASHPAVGLHGSGKRSAAVGVDLAGRDVGVIVGKVAPLCEVRDLGPLAVVAHSALENDLVDDDVLVVGRHLTGNPQNRFADVRRTYQLDRGQARRPVNADFRRRDAVEAHQCRPPLRVPGRDRLVATGKPQIRQVASGESQLAHLEISGFSLLLLELVGPPPDISGRLLDLAPEDER